MSYTPTNWQTGDTVTAEKLNNMESGVEAAVNPFVVTFTPIAQDFSGVMDKTVEEIFYAYEAGKTIVFRMLTSETTAMIAACTVTGHNAAFSYPSFNAFVLTDTPIDALVFAYTGLTDDAEKNTYHTTIYPITPIS